MILRVFLLLKGITLFLLIPGSIYANLSLSLDADARARFHTVDKPDYGLHAAGLLLRKSVADPEGDRFIITFLGETYDSFGKSMVHEASLRLKGPMGRWNVTAGRFTLPYGLLSTYSTTRLPFSTWYDDRFGFDVDNGFLITGIRGNLDYGISLTQGLGPHNRFKIRNRTLLTGRTGWTLDDAGDLSFGASFIHGMISGMHGAAHLRDISGVGIDGTVYSGPLSIRTSLDGGYDDTQEYLLGFLAIQYGILRSTDIDVSVRTGHTGKNSISGEIYTGCTLRHRYFTFRGGYTYAHSTETEHLFTVQLYRLFSAVL